MKQYWTKLASRIDAANLRERILIFLVAVVVSVALVNALLIDPVRSKQDKLARQLKQDQGKIAAIQMQIQDLVQSRGVDPDLVSRDRMLTLKLEIAHSDESLQGMQKGLVQPDRMAGMIADILRRDGALQLVSLKTLPATSILDTQEQSEHSGVALQPGVVKENAVPAPENILVYKHGVELVIRGSYSDLHQYLARLESLPWRMFWGKAELKVEEYPRAALTLTLFTLSLDKTWLRI